MHVKKCTCMQSLQMHMHVALLPDNTGSAPHKQELAPGCFNVLLLFLPHTSTREVAAISSRNPLHHDRLGPIH